MKTKKCRPVLVECSRKSRKGDLVISPTGLGIHISDIEYSVHNKQQLILISLENEKIEVGDTYFNIVSNEMVEVDFTIDYEQNHCKKVIATQSQISPEYIAKFVEQYNNGKVDDVEIEVLIMNEGYTDVNDYPYQEIDIPKLTNGFITIVEKKEPILYTEEETWTLITQSHIYRNKSKDWYNELPEWFERNKKK